MRLKSRFEPRSPRYGLFTNVLELVLALQPFLVSRVDLIGLASKQPVASCKGAASSKQQARAKWGKITAPSWCFGFGQNCGGCYAGVGGTTTQSMSHKLKGGARERVSHVVGLRFKAFCDFGEAKMACNGLKMGSFHLFRHPQWCRIIFGKTHY